MDVAAARGNFKRFTRIAMPTLTSVYAVARVGREVAQGAPADSAGVGVPRGRPRGAALPLTSDGGLRIRLGSPRDRMVPQPVRAVARRPALAAGLAAVGG